MYKVAQESPFEQCIVESLKKLGWVAATGRVVVRIRSLGKNDPKVRNRGFIDEVLLLGRDPLEEFCPGGPPSQVLRRSAKPVIPRHHAAGRGLRQPHPRLLGRFRRMPPKRAGIGIGAGYVRDGLALHHGMRHSALLSAVPYGRVSAPALMIGVEPAGHRRNSLEIGYRADAAAQVSYVHAVPFLLLCGIVPQLPDLEHTFQMAVAIFGAFRIPHPLAVLAVADRRAPGTRPPIREEPVDIVKR